MHHYLESALRLMDDATAGFDDGGLVRRPAEGKWAAAEHVEHLSLTFSGTARMFRKLTASGYPTVVGQQRQLANPLGIRQATPKEWLSTFMVVEMGHMPGGLKSPDFAVPKGLFGGAALAAFREHIHSMDEALRDAEFKFGTSGPVALHIVLGPLTINQWRRFHFVHTRHHMRQVKTIRDACVTA
jgi:hypothetical protein